MALETVLVLPVVATLLVAVLGAATVAADQLAATRSARAAARAVAISGDPSTGSSIVRHGLPGATADVRLRSGAVLVQVTVPGDLLGVAYELRAAARAPLEPGAR